jgi:hypothetical protein
LWNQSKFIRPQECGSCTRIKREKHTKTILAAKTSTIEDALDEDISIETADQYGNTLVRLAAQQGSSRSYLKPYSHKELGADLIESCSLGSILNADVLASCGGLLLIRPEVYRLPLKHKQDDCSSTSEELNPRIACS